MSNQKQIEKALREVEYAKEYGDPHGYIEAARRQLLRALGASVRGADTVAHAKGGGHATSIVETRTSSEITVHKRKAPSGGLDMKAMAEAWRRAGKPGDWRSWMRVHPIKLSP